MYKSGSEALDCRLMKMYRFIEIEAHICDVSMSCVPDDTHTMRIQS